MPRQKYEKKRKADLELARELEAKLQSESEMTVHEFLRDNTKIFWRLFGPAVVADKFRLADDYVPDFVVLADSLNYNVPEFYPILIELESPGCALFTKSGDPTKELTHALKQVRDWRSWLSANHDFFLRRVQQLVVGSNASGESRIPRLMEHLGPDFWRFRHRSVFFVVIGRRQTLSFDDKVRLSDLNHELRDTRVVTYDFMLDSLIDRRDIGALDVWRLFAE